MRVIDLSRVIRPGMPVYPGDPGVAFRPHADYPSAGYRVTEVQFGTHAGTHLDAPAHFLPGRGSVDTLPLEALVGPARVLELDAPAPGIGSGERIVLRSGWGARWGSPIYFSEFPGLPRRLAEHLAEAPAALVALETPSLHPDPGEDARLHRLLLDRGIVILENLVNVELLPEQFLLAALPLPLAGLDGSPARVVALTAVPEPLGHE